MNRRRLLMTGASIAALLPLTPIASRGSAQTAARRWSHTDLTHVANAPTASGGAAEFGQPAAAVLPDRTNIVLFTGSDRHIHQLKQVEGRWLHTDLTALMKAPNTMTSPGVLVRPDGVISILFNAGHIHQFRMRGDTGTHIDLTLSAGAPSAFPFGPPSQFVRGDGADAIVYIGGGAGNRRIHQLSFSDGRWAHANLSELTQTPVTTTLARPSGFVRSGRLASVVYADGHGVTELSLGSDRRWVSNNLSALVQAPKPDVRRWPITLLRSDGVASVVYAAADGFIHELAHVNGRWEATALFGGPQIVMQHGPVGYVRGDRVTAIIYLGTDGHIHELALIDGRWQHTALSLAANAPRGVSQPFGYVRSDGASCVLYRGPDRHLHELSLPRG